MAEEQQSAPQQPAAKAELKKKALKPRDAATLIIVDSSSGEPKVLLGRRRLDMVFMPGRYVFPGGRVDPADRLVPVADDLSDDCRAKLLVDMKGAPSEARARALALAAVRETFEEAGLIIGRPTTAKAPDKAPDWAHFFAHGYEPSLAQLTFFARAITPPGRPRRFDTRFFCAPAQAIACKVDAMSDELSDLEWHSLSSARTLELPNITRVILEDLAERTAASSAHAPEMPVPFYHRRQGSFRRDLITASGGLD
ncbi:MAG: NUDIX hydrolase [Hyphomicrobiaceae bacterium]|nr:NUDIX hydrolase [Hyphomicrobiaceae bacterium]